MYVSIHEAQTNLSTLLERVCRGERVFITNNGVTVAELMPIRPSTVTLGNLKDKVTPAPQEFFYDQRGEEFSDWDGA